jgi:hypothetical protein
VSRSRGSTGKKGLRFYVRLFEGERGLFNKTYEVTDYLDYVAMVSEIRRILWDAYVKRAGGEAYRARALTG